jgi:uncharacterized protein (DUF305 family)
VSRLARALLSLLLIHLASLLSSGERMPGSAGAEGRMQHWISMIAAMNSMHSAMSSANASGDSDKDFIALMLAHHRGAIDMARAELLYGRDPQARRLAQEIIVDQHSEIQLMELWLARHRTGSQK